MNEIAQRIADRISTTPIPSVADVEGRYSPRDLSDGAEVVRFGPSPTGPLHLGGLYTSMLNRAVADRTGGRFILRLEDTDPSRSVEGTEAQIRTSLERFGVAPDESPDLGGDWGPYRQSERADAYAAYAMKLVESGHAYPCFATPEELDAMRKDQQKAKVAPGYYGKFATWRTADEADVLAKLDAGEKFVLRFRAPDHGTTSLSLDDDIRGELKINPDAQDTVILRQVGADLWLPTYHFAHVVDEHLMGVTLVIRGEEWLASLPVHLHMHAALDITPPRYAHIASLMKVEGKSKRKISKRKDPEATVSYYFEEGYPIDAVLAYLRGLANGRLQDIPVSEALAGELHIDQMQVAGPMVDLDKLHSICEDHVATLDAKDIADNIITWASEHDTTFATAASEERATFEAAIDVERVGVDNPRKDLTKWSQGRELYGYFFADIYEELLSVADVTGDTDPQAAATFIDKYLAAYDHAGSSEDWFPTLRETAIACGFAAKNKDYKEDPDAYAGLVKDAAQIVRVLITGSTRSPNLYEIMQVLGEDETRRRLQKITSRS